jgi:hypothetical protein
MTITGRVCPSILFTWSERLDAFASPAVQRTIEGQARPAILFQSRGASHARRRLVMPRVAKVIKRARASSILAGLKKRYEPDDVLNVGGKKCTRRELVDLYQAHLDALRAVDETAAAASAAVAKERAIARDLGPVTFFLKVWVESTLGRSPVILGDFGWEVPKKPGPKTVAAKARGAEKLRETRRLRGTMGKRQRKLAARKLRGG